MSEIHVKEGESIDSALDVFKRSCAKAGVIAEVRKREHYESPSVKRHQKSEAAHAEQEAFLLRSKVPHREVQYFFLLAAERRVAMSQTSGHWKNAAATPNCRPRRSFCRSVSASSKRMKWDSPFLA